MSKKEASKCARKCSIGGQALMEGIMMRGPEKSAMAVRRPNGEIFFEEKRLEAKKRPAICRWPIIRGVFGFVDSMITGYKCLMRSAEIAMEEAEEDAPKAAENTAEAVDAVSKNPVEGAIAEKEVPVEPKEKKEPKSTVGKGTMTTISIIATVLGIALAVCLFIWLPSFLYENAFERIPGWPQQNRWLQSIVEGVLKIVVLVIYMASVSLMKDIRRTFMYHGAEHKTIFCYERGLPLTVENVKNQRRFHPRCGTSFLILMLLVSIGLGFLIPPAEAIGIESTMVYTILRTAIKLLLIPVTMGIGYELLKLAGRFDNIFTRIISAPGMWMQRITVYEPTDDMIECAIKAFVAVLPDSERAGQCDTAVKAEKESE